MIYLLHTCELKKRINYYENIITWNIQENGEETIYGSDYMIL